MLPFHRVAVGDCARFFCLGLVLLALLFAHPESALAQSDHGCATSGAVLDPTTNAALVADCETLLGLKDTLRGWAPLDWDVETPLWQWEGVAVAAVDGVERVTSLSLWERQLNGIIPPELGNLTGLRKLHLDGNQLSGSIPDTLGNLSRLEHLWLHGNELTGEIPATLGNLTRLKTLDLHSNRLTGAIPDQLGNLTVLRELHLHNNLLSDSIPDTLGNLAALEELRLRYNQLSGSIPDSIGNLAKLEHLDLSGNQLSGEIPAALETLPNLRILRLSGNHFHRDSLGEDEFGCISGGAVQNPYDNPGLVTDCETLLELKDELRGTHPLNWSAELDIFDWAGVTVTSVEGRKRVTSLVFNAWDLDGSIPAALGNLAKLEELRLYITKLKGTIPPQLGRLANLQDSVSL